MPVTGFAQTAFGLFALLGYTGATVLYILWLRHPQVTAGRMATALAAGLQDAPFSVRSLETKPYTRRPAAPFTTSTLQQEAYRKLGFSVAQTMSVAQKLYEAGKITRTEEESHRH